MADVIDNLTSALENLDADNASGLTNFVAQANETAASVDDALGQIEQSLTGGEGLSFPGDIDKRRIEFQIKPRNRPSQTDRTTTAGPTVIALPIPTNLSTGYGAQYADTELGPLGGQVLSDVRGGSSVLESLQANGIEALKQSGLSIAASASKEIAAVLGAGAIGKLGLGAAGIGAATGAGAAGLAVGALGAKGIAVNPHLAVLFEGVSFRNHTFQYKFSPRDKSESNSLNAIIHAFKKAMHPTIDEGNKAFFRYPDEFDIRFPNDNGFLFEIGTSVLKDFQLNYTPDGGSYFHKNGAPVSVSFSMTFTEIDILTQKEIGNQPGGR